MYLKEYHGIFKNSLLDYIWLYLNRKGSCCLFVFFLSLYNIIHPLGLANSNVIFIYSDSSPELIQNNIQKYEGNSLKKENSGGARNRMVWGWAAGLFKRSFTMSYCPHLTERLKWACQSSLVSIWSPLFSP